MGPPRLRRPCPSQTRNSGVLTTGRPTNGYTCGSHEFYLRLLPSAARRLGLQFATRRKSSTTSGHPNEKAQTQNDGERCQRSLLNGAFQSISDGGSGIVRGFGADANPLGGV